MYDLLRKYPDTRMRRRVTDASIAPAPLAGVQVYADGNINPASLPGGVVLESEEEVSKEHRVSVGVGLGGDDRPPLAVSH